jgi:hypothetical protein
VGDARLEDLRARLASTRWIDDPAEGNWSYGAPVLIVRALCRFWLDDFDWRAFETKVAREDQLTAQIEGLTFHAMVQRSKRPDAIPRGTRLGRGVNAASRAPSSREHAWILLEKRK